MAVSLAPACDQPLFHPRQKENRARFGAGGRSGAGGILCVYEHGAFYLEGSVKPDYTETESKNKLNKTPLARVLTVGLLEQATAALVVIERELVLGACTISRLRRIHWFQWIG